MKKKCPACGAPLADAAKDFCPKCEKLEVSLAGLSQADFERLSEVVSKRLKGDWKFKAQIFAAVLLVLLAVIGVIDAVVGFNLKENMAAHFRTQEDQARQKIDARLARLDADVETNLAEINVQMRSNIARNFESPLIQEMMASVAKSEAREILKAEVHPAVDRFQTDSDFLRIAARARGYDYKAYLALQLLSSRTNDLAVTAESVLAEIDRSLERDRSGPAIVFMETDGTNYYEGPFVSEELARYFPAMQTNHWKVNRLGFIHTVREQKQPLFMGGLVEFLMAESDLRVADEITTAISELSKQSFHPRDLKRIRTWWSGNQETYSNWPMALFRQGVSDLAATKYEEARGTFEKILKIDTSADVSRCFAILSCWETGATNRAIAMSKEFKFPNARYAKLAAAKTELETGNISNATFQLALIATNYPAMQGRPAQASHVYRKAEWELFDRLTRTNSH